MGKKEGEEGEVGDGREGREGWEGEIERERVRVRVRERHKEMWRENKNKKTSHNHICTVCNEASTSLADVEGSSQKSQPLRHCMATSCRSFMPVRGLLRKRRHGEVTSPCLQGMFMRRGGPHPLYSGDTLNLLL